MQHPVTAPRRANPPAAERSQVLLAVETAGSNCSVAVLRNGALLAAERRPLRHGHAEVLLPMVERVMDAAGLAPAQLAAVAAATGPGGFTGIRVGLAAARGVALAVQAQLVGVSSFAAVAARVAAAEGDGGCEYVLVALDSRRDDLYLQLFALNAATPLAAAAAVPPAGLSRYVTGLVGGTPLLVAGDAGEAAAAVLAGEADIKLAANSAPDALGVAAAALRQLRSGTAAEAVRPFYLRPPDVTLPGRRARTAAAAS